MQGGPRRGRSPITYPALPHAAKAAKTTGKESRRARRAQHPPLRGQARLDSPETAATYTPSPQRAFPNNNPPFPKLHTVNTTPPSPHAARRRTLALRGAQGDRRAERGSSRSKSRAALGQWQKRESPAGCFGGDARGAEKGAQPHNRPRLAARREGGPSNRKRKAPVPAGHNTHLSEDRPCFALFRAPAAHPHALPPHILTPSRPVSCRPFRASSPPRRPCRCSPVPARLPAGQG